MTSREAWLYAAEWGSFMRSGDPGACMYGFSESCRPQSEEHRAQVLSWMAKCRHDVVANPDRHDTNELDKIDEFVQYIKTAPLVARN